jgi:hypothetical protein
VGRDGFHAGLVFFRGHAVVNITMKDPDRVALTDREIGQMRHFSSTLIAGADGCGRFPGDGNPPSCVITPRGSFSHCEQGDDEAPLVPKLNFVTVNYCLTHSVASASFSQTKARWPIKCRS